MHGDIPVGTTLSRSLAAADVYATIRRNLSAGATRAFDVSVALLLLALLLPVMLGVALLIRCDSPGPIIFRQKRIGRGGRPFVFYKFRTMCADAVERFPELYTYAYTPLEIQTMRFKLTDDPRLTRFGRQLRKTSLDELPNLINVLRGDMALVGPRPEIPEMLPYYNSEQREKFTVRPGVTGLAQVSGRGVLRFQETIAADLEWCRRRSFGFNLLILVRTVKCVVCRVGAF